MIIYVDIDETICEHPKTSGKRDYAAATPLVKNIEKINKFYDAGHTIVYWTARGGTTGEDHSLLTSTQLDDWGVKYAELKMGKPSYDIFICDKAINSREFFMIEEMK